MIQSLKSNLSVAEAKFADTAQRLDTNHPQYIAARSEVDKLRANLNEQVRLASTGIASNARIHQQREAEVREALARQKAGVMALNASRDELSVLTNEMENARRAYDAASQRFTQTNIEGQSKQSDIAVLTVATAPRAAASPRMTLNALMSVAVGLILGIGVALMLELLDQRVRSIGHLQHALDLPVLGVLEPSPIAGRRISAGALPLPGPSRAGA